MDNTQTIINKTGHVISVKNKCLEKEIAIDETLKLNMDELGDDLTFRFSFFGFRNQKTERTVEAQRAFDRRLVLWFSSLTEIPMETEISLQGTNEVVLECVPINVRSFWTLFIKTFRLKRIGVSGQRRKQKISFAHSSERRKVVAGMLADFLVLFPLLFVFFTAFVYSFFVGWGIFEKTTLFVAIVSFLYGIIKRFRCLTYRSK